VANDPEVRGDYIPREWLRGGARNIGGKSNKSPMMRKDLGGKARKLESPKKKTRQMKR
jgi:hypothetical protein